MTKVQTPAIPGPGQVILVLDGLQHPMFILPAEMPLDDQRLLSPEETDQLTAVKATLMKHSDAFREFAAAIHTAHTQRLYRVSHSTLAGFLMTYVAFRPVPFEQFLKGNVPTELNAFTPPRARPAKKPKTSIKQQS